MMFVLRVPLDVSLGCFAAAESTGFNWLFLSLTNATADQKGVLDGSNM